MNLIIDTKEVRNVATADVAGAYLKVKMKDFVLVKLLGREVDIICEASMEYEKYVCIDNGKMVLYLRLKKAVYGCMQSAILWYDTFKSALEELGFKINKYDICAANKVMDRKYVYNMLVC